MDLSNTCGNSNCGIKFPIYVTCPESAKYNQRRAALETMFACRQKSLQQSGFPGNYLQGPFFVFVFLIILAMEVPRKYRRFFGSGLVSMSDNADDEMKIDTDREVCCW